MNNLDLISNKVIFSLETLFMFPQYLFFFFFFVFIFELDSMIDFENGIFKSLILNIRPNLHLKKKTTTHNEFKF